MVRSSHGPKLLMHKVLTEAGAGLDKLRGFSLDSANIAFNSSNENQNLEGLATLPNHSVVTIAFVRYCRQVADTITYIF